MQEEVIFFFCKGKWRVKPYNFSMMRIYIDRFQGSNWMFVWTNEKPLCLFNASSVYSVLFAQRCTVCVCKYDYVIMSITVVVLGHSTETNNRTKNNLTVPNISARWCSVIRNKTLPASLITHRAQNSLFYFSAALCFCELRAFGSTRNRIKNKMSPNCLWSGLWSATLNTLSGFLPFGAVCCLSAF